MTQFVSFLVIPDTTEWARHQDEVWKTALGVAKISIAQMKFNYTGLQRSFKQKKKKKATILVLSPLLSVFNSSVVVWRAALDIEKGEGF